MTDRWRGALGACVLLICSGTSGGPVLAADGILVGNFAATTGTAPYTQTISHSLGETPKAIILWSPRALGTSGAIPSFQLSLGMSDGTDDYVVTAVADDGAAAADTRTRISSAVIHVMSDTGTNQGEAVLDSWTSTNFTLEWTTAAASTYRVYYMVIGGSGISADVSSWTSPTSTGNHSVTGVGFEPDAVIHIYSASVNTLDSTIDDIDFGLGVMEVTGDEWALGVFSNDGSDPTSAVRGQQTDAAIHDPTGAGAYREASFVSMDTDGFTVNFSVAPIANINVSLSLAGVTAHAASFTKTTSAAPVSQEIDGHAFLPTAVLFGSFLSAASGSGVNDASFAIGAADGSSEGSFAAFERTGLTTADSSRRHTTASAFTEYAVGGSSFADLTSFDHDGYTLNWTTNTTNAIEICSLAMAPISAVAVRIENAQAIATPEGVEVTWRVTAETNNVGFHLWRERGGVEERVTRTPIPGSLLVGPPDRWSGGGRSLSFRDAEGLAGDRYSIVDLDLNGSSTVHGPFTAVTGTPISPLPTFGTAAGGAAHSVGLGVGLPEPRVTDVLDSRDRSTEDWLAGQPALIVSVGEAGIHEVRQEDWVGAGLPADVDPHHLRLYLRGEEQAIEVEGGADGRFDPGDRVLFPALENPSSNERWTTYWLVEDSRRLPDRSARWEWVPRPSVPAPVALGYRERWVHAPRLAHFPSLRNGDGPNEFAELITDMPLVLPMSFEGRTWLPSEPITVSVELQGIGVGDHVVSVEAGGGSLGTMISLGTMELSGTESASEDFVVPAGVVLSPPLEVRLRTSSATDYVYLRSIEANALCSFEVDDPSWAGSVESGLSVVFPSLPPGTRLFDVTDPARTQELELVSIPFVPEVRWAVSAGGGTRKWWLSSEVLSPIAFRSNVVSAWRRFAAGAEFVIVAPRDFSTTVEPLAAARRLEGLSTVIVPLEDLLEEFSGGHREPEALHAFFADAVGRWATPPRFALLVGEGTTDPRGERGPVPPRTLPVLRLDGSGLETACDAMLGDVDRDGILDLAVGRFPVATRGELEALVKKTLAYSAATPAARAYRADAVTVTDVDADFSFRRAAAQLEQRVPSLSWQSLDLNSGPPAQVADRLVRAADGGRGIVALYGHGGTRAWSEQAVWDDELAHLTENGDRLAVVAIASCLTGYFHHPTFECLAESWLEAPRGGAVAVLASSDLSRPRPLSALSTAWIEAISQPRAPRLGEALLSVQGRVDPIARRTTILLGDPTVRFER